MTSRDAGLVLVVDLDRTLLKTNALDEIRLDSLRAAPLATLMHPKQLLAEHSCANIDSWPVRTEVLDFAKQHADGGGRVVIATSSDRRIADAIVTRFPFITDVIVTIEPAGNSGRSKADILHERFPGGMIYVGGQADGDLDVWRRGARCVLVDAPADVVRKASLLEPPAALFPRKPFGFWSLRRSLRLHQWAKNGLIFVPLVLGGKAGDPSAWMMALLGFLAIGLAASATYIINDLWDLPSDRRHWTKSRRPLASGELSIRLGALMAVGGLAVAFALAAALSMSAAAALAVYVAVTLGYSFSFKRVPVLDVLVLACLFTLRLGFGVVLTQVPLSPWLLVFSMFTFLSLSLAKRHTEVGRMVEHGMKSISGRGYIATDGPFILSLGMASAMGAVLILILYLIEDAFPQQFYSRPEALWAIPPLFFLFLGRIWLLCQRGQLADDPVAFALKDKACMSLGVLSVVAFSFAVL